MSKRLAVEYADTCNFIVGCTGCELSSRGQNICWADKMFNRGKAMNPQTWIHNRQFIGDVQFYRERLQKLNCKIPRFYLNGMGDPFCPDSPLIRDIPNWLEVLSAENEKHLSQTEIYWWHIIQALLKNPQSHLVLLTKWPENIPTDLPDLPNLWIGTSSDGSQVKRIKALWELDYPRKVLSLEPIKGIISRYIFDEYLRNIDWMIIGGLSTGVHDFVPQRRGYAEMYVLKNMIDYCQGLNISVYTKLNLYEFRGKRIPGWEDFEPIKEFPNV